MSLKTVGPPRAFESVVSGPGGLLFRLVSGSNRKLTILAIPYPFLDMRAYPLAVSACDVRRRLNKPMHALNGSPTLEAALPFCKNTSYAESTSVTRAAALKFAL